MPQHILVVDDEAAIADLVEVYLTGEGFAVHKCHSAAEALSCVRSTALDLAILDIMLPDMDGFALCRRIRETHLFPILMLTARGEDLDKITGLTLGADDYVTKPFNPLELVARVKTQLRRYTRYNQGQPASPPEELDIRALQISKAPTSVPSSARSCPSRRWSSPSSGTSARSRGGWCPARSCSRPSGESGTWTATTPS